MGSNFKKETEDFLENYGNRVEKRTGIYYIISEMMKQYSTIYSKYCELYNKIYGDDNIKNDNGLVGFANNTEDEVSNLQRQIQDIKKLRDKLEEKIYGDKEDDYDKGLLGGLGGINNRIDELEKKVETLEDDYDKYDCLDETQSRQNRIWTTIFGEKEDESDKGIAGKCEKNSKKIKKLTIKVATMSAGISATVAAAIFILRYIL